MSKLYDIATLEKISGIKAHTIRIWEQRYKILKPERTPTNIRVYNDSHLQKLLNTKLLLDYGYKISEVASMNEQQMRNIILNVIKTTNDSSYVVYEYFQNELVYSTIELNELYFERTYLNTINKYGVFNTMKNIIYPFMNRIGILWSIGDISPLEEHFASQIIVRKLQSAIDAQDITNTSGETYLLFLLPNEHHQIPLLFANYILRSHKKKTYYLGEDVPVENISKFCKDKPVDYLITFLTTGVSDDVVESIRKIINSMNESTYLVLGGSNDNLIRIQEKIKSKRVIYNKNVNDFIKIISQKIF
ncbi:MAG: MerR family transcriptional regulator [Bacteroidota bacterium]